MNTLIELLHRVGRRLQGWPPGLQITILIVTLFLGRYIWIYVHRPVHRQELAAAYGSVGIFYGAPQSDHAGKRITFVETADVGFGLFLAEVATGQKKDIRQHTGTRPEGDDPKLQVWPWSPDDAAFIYSEDKRLCVCDGVTGKTTTEIEMPTAVVAVTWLTPATFVCIGVGGELFHFGKEADGNWRRQRFATSTDGGMVIRSKHGIPMASSEDDTGGNGAEKAFDGVNNTGWASKPAEKAGWLQYQFDGPAWAISEYRLVSSSTPGADPSNWEILGSNDGKKWTVLDRRANEKFAARFERKPFALTNNAPYGFYRLNVTETDGGSSGIRLAEFQLWSKDSPSVASANAENVPNESAAAAFDGLRDTKWFNSFASPPGWLQYQFGGGLGWALSEYALVSGNDMTNRDPRDWLFQGSNDGKNWTTLDKHANELFLDRKLSRRFYFTNTEPYRIYRLSITECNGTGEEGLQLSECDLGLNRLAAKLNNPSAGLALRNTGGQSSASSAARGSEAEKAFDGQAKTYWSPANPNESAWLQYQFRGPAWTITEYKLISAATNASSDPGSWELLGSNDGKKWTVLDARTNETFPGFSHERRYTISNRTPFWYYRLNLARPASGNAVQLAEFQLWSEDSPTAISASSENPVEEEYATAAFDNVPETKWYNATDANNKGWLQYKSGGGAAWALSKYALTSGNDLPDRDPTDWLLQGSNDEVTWTNLDSRTNEVFDNRYLRQAYTFANATPYRIYRLNVLATSRTGSGLQLAEFELGIKEIEPVTNAPASISATSPEVEPIAISFAGAFSFTAISPNTVVWGQDNRIWSIAETAGTPEMILDLRTIAPGATLNSFSYSRETGQFLLSCTRDGKESLWNFNPYSGTGEIRPISTPGAAKRGIWMKGGGWLAQADDYMVNQPKGGPDPIKFLRHADIQGFTISGDGRKLFIQGTAEEDPSAGIWQYDLESNQLSRVIGYSDKLSPYAKPRAPMEANVQSPSGENLRYNIFAPASLAEHPHRKYPLVIGYTQFGVAVRGAHGRLWVPALSACDAYVVVVDRPDWWKGIEQWGESVTAAYDQVVSTLPIDKNRVFLFGASAETTHISRFMTNSPGLWKGVILLNPTGLPDFSGAPSGPPRPRVLLSAGGLERPETRFKKFQADGMQSGIVVDYYIHPGEGHHLVGNVSQLERTTALVRFLWDD